MGDRTALERRWRAISTAQLGVCLALVVAAIVLGVVVPGIPHQAPGEGLPTWFWIPNASSTIIYAVPGWYLARKRPDVAFGWLALAAALGHGLAAAGFQYAAAAVAGHDLPAPWLGFWFAAWGPVVELPVLAAIYALFPDARRPRGRLGVLAWTSMVVVSVGVLAGLFDPVLVIDPASRAVAAQHNPIAIHIPLVHTLDGAATFAPGMILATVVVVLRWRAAQGESRRVLSWLAIVAVLAFVVAAPAASFAGWTGVLAAQLVSLVEVAVITAAVLRERVFGIVVVLNRTLVYVALTVAVALVYLATVATLANVASHGLSAAVGTIVAALVVTPGRERIQRGVNRFLYGQRDEPYAVISAVSQRLTEATSAEELLQGFVEEVARSVRVPYLCLALEPGPEEFAAGSQVADPLLPPSSVETFEVRHEGRLVGHLSVRARAGQSDLSSTDRRLFRQLADQASVAVANYSLTVDLRRSRARIVAAREEERRRLRRDLHDGLGPQLTGISLALDATADSLTTVAPREAASLEALRGELGEAIVDIRRLVHDLRPPSLDELGLLGAIEDLAHRVSRGDLAVSVVCHEPLPELSAAVEVSALRIVSEAINNVARHAEASTCQVTVTALHDELRIRVVDDGRGLAPQFRAGVGTGSMRERAEEVGGRCTLANGERGGVVVEVLLPVVASAGAA